MDKTTIELAPLQERLTSLAASAYASYLHYADPTTRDTGRRDMRWGEVSGLTDALVSTGLSMAEAVAAIRDETERRRARAGAA